MFKKLKKLLKNLLRLETEKKSAPNNSAHPEKTGKNRKKNSSAKVKKNDLQNKTVKPDKEKKKNKKNSGKNSSASAPKIPPMPESLIEVPVVEGKTRFLDLDLHLLVKYGVQNAGFEYCTPIQQMSLPPLLEQRDLAGKAQTGTGKTAAFLLASFTKLLNTPQPEPRTHARPRMVVMAPTRELAMQIHKDACELGIFTGLNIAVVFVRKRNPRRESAVTRVQIVILVKPACSRVAAHADAPVGAFLARFLRDDPKQERKRNKENLHHPIHIIMHVL